MNAPFLVRQLALLLLVLAGIMLLIAAWGWLQTVWGEPELDAARALAIGAGASGFIGGVCWLATRTAGGYLDRRQALLLVVLSWILAAVLGGVPYCVWTHLTGESGHVFRSPVACIFEAMSGLTTTGATVLADIEAVPRSLLLWRAVTHWLGGLGIIVLFVAVLPSLGVGGRRLFGVESPGPQPGGVHPQIRETARVLWFIYSALTAAEIIALRLAGMDWYDSVCHAFATLATGGFSTKGASIGYYTPVIQWIVIFFMVVAGVNFGLYHGLIRRKFRDVFRDPELRVYLVVLLAAAGALGLSVYGTTVITTTGAPERATLEAAARHGMFNATAIQTTTGFGTADFTLWSAPSKLLLVVLMFIGGCAGSTAGGIKVIRVWIGVKVLINEVERIFRPQVVRPLRVGGKALDPAVRMAAVVYIVGMLLIFVLGAFAVMLLEGDRADMTTALSASVATLCTIGPGLGGVGPVENYGWMKDSTLATLSVLMLMGRLEVLTVLVLAAPSFWRGG